MIHGKLSHHYHEFFFVENPKRLLEEFEEELFEGNIEFNDTDQFCSVLYVPNKEVINELFCAPKPIPRNEKLAGF